jgi:hypothetical protein
MRVHVHSHISKGWDSIDDHTAFKTSRVYTDFMSALKPALAPETEPVSALVHLASDALPSLSAPATELLWVTPKAGVAPDAVREVLKKIDGFFPSAIEEGLAYGSAIGDVVDGPGMLFLGGWRKVEVRFSAVSLRASFDYLARICRQSSRGPRTGPSYRSSAQWLTSR